MSTRPPIKSPNLLLDSLAYGDAKTAISWVSYQGPEQLAEALKAMTLRAREKGDPPLLDMRWTSRWKCPEISGLLDALVKRTSPEAMAPVRLTVLGRWLKQTATASEPWRLDDIAQLAGVGGLDPKVSTLTALSRAHADDVLVRQRASPPMTPVEGFTWNHPAMDAAHWAAAAHCEPLLRVLAPTVEMAPQHDGTFRGAGLSLDLVVRQGADNDLSFHWDLDRFKTTVAFMASRGHSPLALSPDGQSLIHELAEHASSDPVDARANADNLPTRGVFGNPALMTVIDQKLMHLIDLGVDRFAKDSQNHTAVDLLNNLGQPDLAHRFELVSRTYASRKSAMQALEDMEMDFPSP